MDMIKKILAEVRERPWIIGVVIIVIVIAF